MSPKSDTPSGEHTRFLIGKGSFRFACHSGVACYTRCCHNADMYLYPIDIIRLKQRLGISSEQFLIQHTLTAIRENPYFPNVMLKMSDQEGHPCAFLTPEGCSVYDARPYSCRAYPMEPAIYGDTDGKIKIRCYVAKHTYCLGHHENPEWTAGQWMENQEMNSYTEINAQWAQIDTLFRKNPFGDQGIDHPAMKMAYMASFNVDTFRRFVLGSSFLERFDIPQDRLEAVRQSDTALLQLGFDWIRQFLTGGGSLREQA